MEMCILLLGYVEAETVNLDGLYMCGDQEAMKISIIDWFWWFYWL